MKLVTIPAGVKVIDRDAVVTEAQAALFWSAGVRVLARCIDHISIPAADLSKSEIESHLRKGFAVIVYQQYLHDQPFTAQTGRARGELAAKSMAALGCPADAPCYGDLEGAGASHDDGVAFLNAWNAARRAAGQPADEYLSGIGFSLTRAELDASGTRSWWRSGAKPHEDPSAGYALEQGATTTVAGIEVDLDEIQGDGLIAIVSDDWTPAMLATSTSPGANPAAPTGPAFTFAARAGEIVGDRHARCWEEALELGPMGHALRGPWYASFVDVGQGAQHIEAWSTSCAITQHASLVWCGDGLHASANGSGIFEEVGAREDHPAWQKNDGSALPSRGDILFWQTPGTNNGHVECVLHRNADGSWTTAGGGGGADGTECSIRIRKAGPNGSPLDPYGRPLQGWWRVALLGLPVSPPKPEDPPKQVEPSMPDPPADKPATTPPATLDTTSPAANPDPPTAPPRPRPPLKKSIVQLGSFALAAGGTAIDWMRAHPAAILAAFVVATAVFVFYEVEHHKDAVDRWIRSLAAHVHGGRLLWSGVDGQIVVTPAPTSGAPLTGRDTAAPLISGRVALQDMAALAKSTGENFAEMRCRCAFAQRIERLEQRQTRLEQQGAEIMKSVQDFVAAFTPAMQQIQANIGAVQTDVGQVGVDVTSLSGAVTTLVQKLGASNLSADDQAALDDVLAKTQAVVASSTNLQQTADSLKSSADAAVAALPPAQQPASSGGGTTPPAENPPTAPAAS